MNAESVKIELNKLANPKKAEVLARFFKTEKGEYGEGDLFLGITVPNQRNVAIKFREIGFNEVQQLLHEKYHEYRLTALLIMVQQYQKGDGEFRQKAVNFYLKNTSFINNWDLVDLSAPKIIGDFLLHNKSKRILLYRLSVSENLWERRISIIATYPFIKAGQFEDTLKISKALLNDSHDLIHKAVGWMLREVGKIDRLVEEEFLQKYYQKMPRTMLRYAIERFEPEKRAYYMKK